MPEIDYNEFADTQLNQYMSGKGFDIIIKAVDLLAGRCESEEGIGILTIKCAQIKRGIALRDNNDVERQDAENFLALMEAE